MKSQYIKWSCIYAFFSVTAKSKKGMLEEPPPATDRVNRLDIKQHRHSTGSDMGVLRTPSTPQPEVEKEESLSGIGNVDNSETRGEHSSVNDYSIDLNLFPSI